MSQVFTKELMPVLARHAGDWYGIYVHTDALGKEIDRHYSHLISVYPTDGSCHYHQTNRYLWEDGRKEEHLFPGNYDFENQRIIFDTERIWGWARDIDERHVQLMFTYKGGDDKYVYEFVHLSDDGQHRTRIWHWYNENGEVYKRTLIKESREATPAHDPIK
ncbi:DUF3598 family protein [Aggregatilineales bacterium SYSU G02658]